MLILTRHEGQAINIDGHTITVRVLGIRGRTVRLGIEAPNDVSVHREEIQLQLDQPEATPGNKALTH